MKTRKEWLMKIKGPGQGKEQSCDVDLVKRHTFLNVAFGWPLLSIFLVKWLNKKHFEGAYIFN